MRRGYGSDEDDREPVYLYVHGDTEAAWRVSVDGDDEDSFWLPKSQCDVVSKIRRTDLGQRTAEFLIPG